MNNSNQPADRVYLTNEVERLSAALDDARADVALLLRLKNAEKDAARIAGDLSAAQNALANAIADAVTASRDVEFANLRGLSVEAVPNEGGNSSALGYSYVIRYERLTHDNRSNSNHWKVNSVTGFQALEADVFRYLMLANPHTIPASIMALAPGDADKAMKAYFVAKQRGYISTPAATVTIN
jgi:hypothetical protein